MCILISPFLIWNDYCSSPILVQLYAEHMWADNFSLGQGIAEELRLRSLIMHEIVDVESDALMG